MSTFFKFTIISSLLVLTGCTPKIYNTPYIDATETIQLEYQLTKDEVINLLGKPLYVESGNKVNDEVFWIYEVRARSVKSETSLSLGKLSIVPNKDHNDTKPTTPIHHLRITFIDGKVSHWKALVKDKKKEEEKVDKSENEKEKKVEGSIVEKLKRKSKKKEKTPKKFFFHPKVGIDVVSYQYNDYYYTSGYCIEYSEPDPYTGNTDCIEYKDGYSTGSRFNNESQMFWVFGAYFGLETPNYRLGLDTKIAGNAGIMATIEKRNVFNLFNFIIGVGMYDANVDSYKSKAENAITFFKFGLSKDLTFSSKSISLGLDLQANEFSLDPAISFSLPIKIVLPLYQSP